MRSSGMWGGTMGGGCGRRSRAACMRIDAVATSARPAKNSQIGVGQGGTCPISESTARIAIMMIKASSRTSFIRGPPLGKGTGLHSARLSRTSLPGAGCREHQRGVDAAEARRAAQHHAWSERQRPADHADRALRIEDIAIHDARYGTASDGEE